MRDMDKVVGYSSFFVYSEANDEEKQYKKLQERNEQKRENRSD